MSQSLVSNTVRVGALLLAMLVGYTVLAQEKSPAEDASKKTTSPSQPSATTPATPQATPDSTATKQDADNQKQATESKAPASSTDDTADNDASSAVKEKSPSSSNAGQNQPTSPSERAAQNRNQDKAGDADPHDTAPGQSGVNNPNSKSRTTTNANEQFRFNQPRTQRPNQPSLNRARDNNDEFTPNRNRRDNREYADEDDRPAPPDESQFDQRRSDASSNDNRDDYNNDRGADNRRFSNQPGRLNRRVDDRDRDDDRDYDRADNRNNRRDDDRDVNVSIGARIDVDDSDRLIIRELYSSGFLARANVRVGDVIVSVNNQPIYSTQNLIRYVHNYRGNGPIPIVILRGGVRQTIYVDQPEGYYVDDTPEELAWVDEHSAWLGVNLNARYATSAVVQEVQPGSPAEKAGVQPNDWIVSINGQRIMSPHHLSQVVRDMEPGVEISLQVSRRVLGELQATLSDRPSYNDDRQDRPERPTSYEE
jgi:hypothetical protein